MKNKNQILDDALSSAERVQFENLLEDRRNEHRVLFVYVFGFIFLFALCKCFEFQLDNIQELTHYLGGAALSLSAWGLTVFLSRIAKTNN